MESKHILSILQQVQDGAIDIHAAYDKLKISPFEDLGYAKIDHHRKIPRARRKWSMARERRQGRWKALSIPFYPIAQKTS